MTVAGTLLHELSIIRGRPEGEHLPTWVPEAASNPSTAVRAAALTLMADDLLWRSDRSGVPEVQDLLARADREFALVATDDDLIPFRWAWFRTRMFALDRLDDQPRETEQAVRDAYAFARDHDYDPGIRAGKTNLGLRAADVGRPVEALLHFVDLFGLMPPDQRFHGYAHRGIARLLAGALLHDQAVSQLELSDECLVRSDAQASGRVLGLTDLGMSAVEAKNFARAEQAIATLDELAEHAPESDDNSRAGPRLIEVKLRSARGRPSEALRVFERHRVTIERAIPYWFWHPAQVEAEALLAAGRVDEALALAQHDHNLFHVQLANQHRLLAGCHAALEQWEQAIAHQREAERRRSTYVFDPAIFLSIGRTRLDEIEHEVADLWASTEHNGNLLRKRDAMLSHVIHEVRNPLTALLGHLDLWGLPDTEPNRPFDMLHSIVERIRSSTVALRSQARRTTSTAGEASVAHDTLSTVQLDLLVADVVALFSPVAEAKGSTIVWHDSAPLDLRAPADPIRLAVSNVLSNALKFSPPGSTIEVQCHATTACDLERVGSGQSEHNVAGVDLAQVSILDQGPGFTADDLARAFTPNTRLSARPTAGELSTGVGLSLTKTSIETSGGRVMLDNRPGGGAVVTLEWPLHELVGAS